MILGIFAEKFGFCFVDQGQSNDSESMQTVMSVYLEMNECSSLSKTLNRNDIDLVQMNEATVRLMIRERKETKPKGAVNVYVWAAAALMSQTGVTCCSFGRTRAQLLGACWVSTFHPASAADTSAPALRYPRTFV